MKDTAAGVQKAPITPFKSAVDPDAHDGSAT